MTEAPGMGLAFTAAKVANKPALFKQKIMGQGKVSNRHQRVFFQ
jgi:Spy/CpxP family protein refolding chaperone